MGGFASNTLTVLLSWVQSVASLLWNLFAGGDTGGMTWFAAHWRGIAFGLCIAGALVDFAVYLLRWRPDKVWRSFFRRVTAQRRGADGQGSTAQPGDVFVPDPYAELARAESKAREARAANATSAEAATDSEEQPEFPVDSYTPRQRRAVQAKPNSFVQRLSVLARAATAPDEQRPRLHKPLSAIDKQEMFHEPFIPEQWHKPGDAGANRRRRRYDAHSIISEEDNRT